MKNIEKYKKEISQLVNEGDDIECAIATAAGIAEKNSCSTHDCKECQKKCLEWMYSEYKEQILTDDEKDIVKAMCDVIHKFVCTVISVRKRDVENGDCFIRTTLKNIVTGRLYFMNSPFFNNDMFEGMETGKEYTIEELGITCQTQKDS